MNPVRIRVFAAVGLALLAVFMTGNAPANAVVMWHRKTPPLSTPWTHLVGPSNALPEYPRDKSLSKKLLDISDAIFGKSFCALGDGAINWLASRQRLLAWHPLLLVPLWLPGAQLGQVHLV